MTRRPINRSPLIPQQQALVDQQAGQQTGRREVLDAVGDLLGESVDPDVVAARDELAERFEP